MLLFFSSKLWLLGYVGSASIQLESGARNLHWNSWGPWVCLCELHKQARIRHFVVWAANVSMPLEASSYWQEKECSLQECVRCTTKDCPGSDRRSGFLPPFQDRFSPEPELPLPPHLDLASYDSLPVVDDTGEI